MRRGTESLTGVELGVLELHRASSLQVTPTLRDADSSEDSQLLVWNLPIGAKSSCRSGTSAVNEVASAGLLHLDGRE